MSTTSLHPSWLPRTLVVGGNLGRWSASQRLQDADHVSGIEAWVFATNGDYVNHKQLNENDIREHDLVILNTNYIDDKVHMQKLVRMCENRPQNTKLVCLLEGDMRDYLKPREQVRELFNASDLVNCINHHATESIRLLTSTSVEYIGIPYPVDGVQTFRLKREQREKRIHLCPFLLSRWTEYLIAKEIGVAYSGYERLLSRRLSLARENLQRHGSLLNKNIHLERAARMYSDPQLFIHNECWFTDYYRQSAGAYFWLNMEDRYTWGRHVLDAAALGVPLICTRSTGHADTLFPSCMLETPFDVVKAIELGKRLLNDVQFYNDVVTHADREIDKYRPEIIREKLFQHLDLQS